MKTQRLQVQVTADSISLQMQENLDAAVEKREAGYELWLRKGIYLDFKLQFDRF